MVRNSFVFYKSFFEAIKELENKDKGIISYAIMEYGLTGELPNLTGYLKSMFLLIKPQIDANNKKYENGRKGADFGFLGGRPKTPKKPLDNPKQTPNVDVDVDVNEDVNENEDVDVKGKGDCKGKNQAGIVDKLKTESKDTALKQSLKQSLRLGFLGEDPVKLESNKGINGLNDKTDFSFGEKRGTANDRTPNDKNDRTPNRRTENSKSTASEEGITMPASAEIISSTSANTFKARVEYAKSLGIEERVAREICNFAQSKKFSLFETHYKGFVGKSEKEVEEAFSVLKLVVQRSQSPNGQSPKGLRHINSS
jgi:hypothetical protein